VLLSTPLHASSNFTVSVQLANKGGSSKNAVLANGRIVARLVFYAFRGVLMELLKAFSILLGARMNDGVEMILKEMSRVMLEVVSRKLLGKSE
jgi:hypothetical protein